MNKAEVVFEKLALTRGTIFKAVVNRINKFLPKNKLMPVEPWLGKSVPSRRAVGSVKPADLMPAGRRFTARGRTNWSDKRFNEHGRTIEELSRIKKEFPNNKLKLNKKQNKIIKEFKND